MAPAIVLAAWLVVQTAPRLYPSDLMLRPKWQHLCLDLSGGASSTRRELDKTRNSAAAQRERAEPHVCERVRATPKLGTAPGVGGTTRWQGRDGSRRSLSHCRSAIAALTRTRCSTPRLRGLARRSCGTRSGHPPCAADAGRAAPASAVAACNAWGAPQPAYSVPACIV